MSRLWDLAVGVALGALAGMLVAGLGLPSLTGLPSAACLSGAIVIGGGLAWWHRERWLVATDIVLLGIFGIIGFTPLIQGAQRRWIREDTIPDRPVDAVVVLSGALTPDSTLQAEAADRLLTGLQLIRRGVASRLVTTRVTGTDEDSLETSDADQRRIIELTGLHPEWLIADSVRSTHDEAVHIAALLRPRGATTIVVVTSPLHTRRACATFERVGFRVVCVGATMRTSVSRNPINAGRRVAVFRDYLYERLGMVKYRARGWIR